MSTSKYLPNLDSLIQSILDSTIKHKEDNSRYVVILMRVREDNNKCIKYDVIEIERKLEYQIDQYLHSKKSKFSHYCILACKNEKEQECTYVQLHEYMDHVRKRLGILKYWKVTSSIKNEFSISKKEMNTHYRNNFDIKIIHNGNEYWYRPFFTMKYGRQK